MLDEDVISGLNTVSLNGVKDRNINAKSVIRAMHANSVLIEVDTEQAGILVLHDIFYPGWQATIDDVPVPVLRANILFRGVEVAAGHHLVRFEYHPFSLENLTAAASSLLHR